MPTRRGERSSRGIERLGLRDLFVLLPDSDRYFTADVRTAARNLWLRIVGSAT
jgi:hypothetical protein